MPRSLDLALAEALSQNTENTYPFCANYNDVTRGGGGDVIHDEGFFHIRMIPYSFGCPDPLDSSQPFDVGTTCAGSQPIACKACKSQTL